MQKTILGVTFTINGKGIVWEKLPDVKKLDDEPQYPMGCRHERLVKGKIEVYRYTQFPNRGMKFGWLLEIPDATYQMGGKIGAYL